MYKWRIVLGGLASVTFLGTFAAVPALASTASADRVPVVVNSAALPSTAQLLPGALGALTTLPALGAVTGPVNNLLGTLGTVTGALGSPSGPLGTVTGALGSLTGPLTGGTPAAGTSAGPLDGVLPAVGAATGALLNGLGSVTSNLSETLLPAVGPAVGGLTAPIDGLTQDLSNLAGVPVLGALVGALPALPDTGALLGDLNGLVNGVAGAKAGS